MTVHHILPESEPFSEHFGGALSRWVANVLARDSSGIVLAPASDSTWSIEPTRVRVWANLHRYGRFVALCRGRVPSRLRKLLVAASLRTALSNLSPDDVVYVHNRPEFAAGIQAAYPERRFKLVLHMHNSHLLDHPLEFAQCADLTVFCSRFLMEEAAECVGDIHSMVIPNGADSSYFFPGNPQDRTGPPRILFVGRLVPAKGAHVLLKAMRVLQQRGVRARAVIVGGTSFGVDRDTPYVRELKAAAPSNVEFLPYQSGAKLAEEFRRATVFCCPSVFEEPFGMVNVEAMASGLPVIAAKVGGIPEVFHEGGGLLVPPAHPKKLADALDQVLQNPDVRYGLAREGQASFRKNYTWEVVRRKYRNALASLAA